MCGRKRRFFWPTTPSWQRPEALTRFCSATLAQRQKQKRQIVEKLGAFYPIRWEDVLAAAQGSAAVQESHIMAVLADMGYTNSVIGPHPT